MYKFLDFKFAHTLREILTVIFELHLTKDQALERLTKWQAKVHRSSLTGFDKFLTPPGQLAPGDRQLFRKAPE